MLRHGAHHVNIWSFSGSSARPTSTSPWPMIRSSCSRSDGSWPMIVGFRSFGCTSMSGTGNVQIAAHDQRRGPSAIGDELLEGGEEAHLGLEILAAIRHVDRRDGDRWQRNEHDPVFVIEVGMFEGRALGRQALADVQPYARVAFRAVPVTPVAFHFTQRSRHLVLGCFDLLQAYEFGAFNADPLL